MNWRPLFKLFGFTTTYSPHSLGSNEVTAERFSVRGVRMPIEDNRRSCSSLPKKRPENTAPPRGTYWYNNVGENTREGRRTCQRAVAELGCLTLAIRTSMSGASRSIRCLMAIQSDGS